MTNQKIALLFLLACLPICGLGIQRFESNMEDVFQWLPDESQERRIYDRFVGRFGADDFVVVSWPTCDLNDPRADLISQALRGNSPKELIDDSVSGRELIEQLRDAARLDPAEIIERFRGFYFGLHSNHTCVIVSLTEKGMANRRDTITHIKSIARGVLGSDSEHLVFGGYPQVGAYGDEVIRSSMTRLVGPSCLVSTLIAWLCLRDFRTTVAILITSALGAGLSIAFVTLTGSKWGGLSSIIPTLAYIMTVSGSVHLANYGRNLNGPGLARQILRIGWKPCLFSAITTSVGMLSLCRSDFPAVRAFGAYCAAGVMGAVVCQLILIPVALEWLHRQHGNSSEPHWQDHLLRRLMQFDRQIVFFYLLIAGGLCSGLATLNANMEVERNFRADSPVMQDIQWLEHSLGPLEQTEVVLSFPASSADRFTQRLRIVAATQRAIDALPTVHGTLSLANSLPSEPGGGGLRQLAARVGYSRALSRVRDQLQESRYLSLRPDEEAWRLSIRIPFLESTDFAELEKQVRHAIKLTLAEVDRQQEVTVEYTGVSHLYHVAQIAVMKDLYWNFASAFLLICPLMILAVKSWLLGLVAMIPNLFPAVIVFGGMGLIHYPIDIAIAMTACVALGIAVDDTTHFLLRFRELEQTATTPFMALQTAFHQCSTAMLHTTLITSLGLAVFIGGPLATMTRFAVVLIALLVVALICDLTLLPPLLNATGFVRKTADADSTPPGD